MTMAPKYLLSVIVCSALALSALPAEGAMFTDSYDALTVTVNVPDAIAPDADFELLFQGTITDDKDWAVSSYAIYLDADWSYTDSHMVAVNSGELIAADGFMWSGALDLPLLQNLPEGTYTYTFVYGYRSGAHNWYDLAIDVTVTVAPTVTICDPTWLTAARKPFSSARTIPLRFSLTDCETGAFYFDDAIYVDVVDGTGVVVADFEYTGNPNSGLTDNGSFYQVNWKTAGYGAGTYTVSVWLFGQVVLSHDITLK